MADPDLQSLPSLTPRQKALLRRAGLQTPSELLLPPLAQVTAKLNPIAPADLRELLTAVAHDVVPPFELVGARSRAARGGSRREGGPGKGKGREESLLSLGDDELDRVLGGGLRMDGSITELVGESSAGKTQLALALTVRAALMPGLADPSSSSSAPAASHAVYLSSEGHLPTTRLISLLPSSRSAPSSTSAGVAFSSSSDFADDSPASPDRETAAAAVLSRIHFLAPTSVEALLHVLSYLLPGLLTRLTTSTTPHTGSASRPRLIVLDSLAALVRSSFASDKAGLAQRAQAICEVADRLRAVGRTFGCAVVVVNQVADVFGENPWRMRSLAAGDDGSGYYDHAGLSSLSSSPSPFASSSSSPLTASQLGPPPTIPLRSNYPLPAPNLGYAAQTRYFNGSSPRLAKEASLGLVWSNSVSTRVMLSRTERFVPIEVRGLDGVQEEDEGGRLRVRRLDVVFGPGARSGEGVEWVVQTSRVAGLKTVKAGIDGAASARGGKRQREDAGEEQGASQRGGQRPRPTRRDDEQVERAKARRRAAVLGLLTATTTTDTTTATTVVLDTPADGAPGDDDGGGDGLA